jgi:hypothetical protein
VLLSIVEELEDIISDDDSGLSAENVKGTHIVVFCECSVEVVICNLIVVVDQ